MSERNVTPSPEIKIKQTTFQVKHLRLPWILIILLFVIIGATIFAPLITPYDPEAISLNDRFLPPVWQEGGSSKNLLGTDELGRDLLTRIFYGGRVSLLVALLVLTTGGLAGLALGILAGYLKGKLGVIIMRLVDSLMAIPAIFFALIFAVTLGSSMKTVVIALAVVLWARIARVIRGDVLTIANKEFISQAKVAGASPLRIMLLHILPNTLNTFMILLSLNLGWVILMEASMSFLGAGIPPPTPVWGQMVAAGRGYFNSAWWISFFPGVALALTVLAFNLFGDWLRDKLDPKLRQL